MNGHMIWNDKRIAVRDVKEGPRMDAEGVRDGWDATTDDAIASRMFYPADMFTFEPGVPAPETKRMGARRDNEA